MDTNPEGRKNQMQVVLPCDENGFKNFISGLLGKPQTLTKIIRGCFEVEKNDIGNFYHLITQRIFQQNAASLINFSAKIVYNDNSTVTLNSFDDFNNYHEIKALISTAVHLNWEFLIKFPDRETAEKQEIDVSYMTNAGPVFDSDVEFDGPIFFDPTEGLARGFISVRIKHTARSWGADMMALITSHIENHLLKLSSLREYIRKHAEKIALVSGALIFMSSLYVCFHIASKMWLSNKENAANFIGEKINLSEKVNYILQMVSNDLWPKYYFSSLVFLVFMLFISIFITTYVEKYAKGRRNSFVLLTDKSLNEKEKTLKKYEHKWIKFIVSVILSFIINIVSNIIYLKFWK